MTGCASEKILFVDRDGTILVEPVDNQQIDSLEKLHFVPGVITALKTLSDWGYTLIMVTNQDGLGTSSFPEEAFWPAHERMLEILAGEGVTFSEILIDRSRPEEESNSRKPGLGLVHHLLQRGFDRERSWVIGDRGSDEQFARNINCRSIRLASTEEQALDQESERAYRTDSWRQACEYVLSFDRFATVTRNTRETEIQVALSLDGRGRAEISTGLGFLDHMLEQITKHAAISLSLQCRGDLHVDEHHTVEDCGLALGAALRQALGDKRRIERFGYSVPMDESLAHVTLDLSGRSFLTWDAPFARERIGDLPTELFSHFFRSLCNEGKFTLHVTARGENEHHKIEAIFKTFARVLRLAIERTGVEMPSTKGIL